MSRAKIYITLKKGILDPQGVTVKKALDSLGYSGIEDVRVGKYMEIKADGLNKDIIQQMCERLLANPVIEDYRFEIEEVE
ncbi:MAG: phosphoribosylformylglycinamidine synthase subunit PurS [bacterium]|nr:phosphoribosylformylglycinamidine synthase subunit PurS [bacterium]